MRGLIDSMMTWHHERYLDPGVWDHLRKKINDDLMPAPNILPDEKRKHRELEYQVGILQFDNFNRCWSKILEMHPNHGRFKVSHNATHNIVPISEYAARLCFHRCLSVYGGRVPWLIGLQSLVPGRFWRLHVPSWQGRYPETTPRAPPVKIGWSPKTGITTPPPHSCQDRGNPPHPSQIGVSPARLRLPPQLHRNRTDVRDKQYASCIHTGGLSCCQFFSTFLLYQQESPHIEEILTDGDEASREQPAISISQTEARRDIDTEEKTNRPILRPKRTLPLPSPGGKKHKNNDLNRLILFTDSNNPTQFSSRCHEIYADCIHWLCEPFTDWLEINYMFCSSPFISCWNVLRFAARFY